MHGGKTHPRRGSAAAHGGEGTLLAAGPREARSYLKQQGQQHLAVFSMHSVGCSQQRHVESPHLLASPLPEPDPERSEPGGAGVRGRGALSAGSTRGARGGGGRAERCERLRGFESFGELPKDRGPFLKTFLEASNAQPTQSPGRWPRATSQSLHAGHSPSGMKQRIFSLRVRDTERFIDNDATLAIEWAKANENGKTLRLNILPCSATSSRHTSTPSNRP